MPLNVLMMATGEFALPSLEALVDSPHRVIALVTQPDRVNPRGKKHPHPLKEYALSRNLPVWQPESINEPNAIARLKSLRPDVVIVAAYGQILKRDVIGVPPRGMFNLHASLLPRHRGAAPVQYAVWCGDSETGVSVFQIEPKLDAGPILVMKSTEVGPKETSGELHDRLAILGAQAVLESVEKLDQGPAELIPQTDEGMTLAPKIRKEQGQIDWNQTANQIDCHIRAMQPWPNAFSFFHQTGRKPERVLILEAEKQTQSAKKCPGKIETIDGEQILVATGEGLLDIQRIQPAGKKPMSGAEFFRGRQVSPDDFFGPEVTASSDQ